MEKTGDAEKEATSGPRCSLGFLAPRKFFSRPVAYRHVSVTSVTFFP